MAERNIDEIFDRIDILESIYRYCSAADRFEPDAMVAEFTPDATVSYMPDQPPMNMTELLAMLKGFLCDVASGSHHITNPVFDFHTPGEAKLGCYLFSWQRFKEFPRVADIHRWGCYELHWVRLDGAWKMKHMELITAGEYGGTRLGEQMGRDFFPIKGG